MYRNGRLASVLLSLGVTASALSAGAGLVPVALTIGCQSSPQYGDVHVSSKLEAADGLDLKAVGELVKTVRNAKELEQKLNEPGGVNNLDLNADGKVDFISVTEYGNDKAKGFSLTVQPEKGETQEIATVEIEKPSESSSSGSKHTDVYVRGNHQVYGPHHHYHFPFTEMLLLSYLFRPHPLYVSPFGFGYYPPYFGLGYAAVPHTTYVTRTRTITRGSVASPVTAARKSSVQSPNAGKSASRGIRRSLRSPTQSQRSFQRRAGAASSSRGFAQRVRERGTSRRTSPGTSRRTTPARSAPRRSFGRRSFGSRGFRSRR